MASSLAKERSPSKLKFSALIFGSFAKLQTINGQHKTTGEIPKKPSFYSILK